jgi:hypothetical protein
MCLERTSSGCWEFSTSYYTVKLCVITSDITYLLGRTKPAGSPLPCSQYALSRTQGLNRGVVKRIDINTNVFVPNFRTHFIYIYTSIYLQLQPTWTCTLCPVSGEFGGQHPTIEPPGFSRSLPQLAILGAKMIGMWTQHKNSFIRLFTYSMTTNNV